MREPNRYDPTEEDLIDARAQMAGRSIDARIAYALGSAHYALNVVALTHAADYPDDDVTARVIARARAAERVACDMEDT